MDLNNPAAVGLMVLLFTPLVNFCASLFKQQGWPKQLNAIVALVVSGLGGVGLWLLAGNLHGLPSLTMILGSASAIFAASQIVYHAFGFKDSWLDTVLADISLLSRPQPLVTTPLLPWNVPTEQVTHAVQSALTSEMHRSHPHPHRLPSPPPPPR